MTEQTPGHSGSEMMEYARRLFPICRSLTGDGVRETLRIIKEICGDLEVYEVPTGTKVFDWEIPEEWNIRDAYIIDPDGKKIADFKENNLHVMGYSEPVDKTLSLDELKEHLYTQVDLPDAVPYVTSYYKKRWGFCISENTRASLKEGVYRVFIDSDFKQGHLTYGELLISGKSKKEILISTYVCHPSMANNEVSGPVLAAFLGNCIRSLHNRRYSYRIVFLPETIGAITYLSKNFEYMKENTIAGFVLSCVGDNRAYSHIQSPYGDTLADKVLRNVLSFIDHGHMVYSFLERGSDERQYCAPNINLPVCCFCRSKFGEYPEYHTDQDNLELISEEGFEGAFNVMRDCIEALEHNNYYKVTCFCEPQLGKRGLYPTLSKKGSATAVKAMTDFIAYADGTNDLIDISNIINVPVAELIPIIKTLKTAGLISPQVR